MCCQCETPIPTGSPYTRHAGVYDDSFFDQKLHNECYDLHMKNNADSDNDEWFGIFDCDYDAARKIQVSNLLKYKNDVIHYVVYVQEKDGDETKPHYVSKDLERARESYSRKMSVTKEKTKGTVQLEHIVNGRSYVHQYHWWRDHDDEVNGRQFSPPHLQPERSHVQ